MFVIKRIVSILVIGLMLLSISNAAFAQKNVSIVFANTDVKVILQTIAQSSGVNIVIDGSINKKISVSLNNEPFDKALQIICQTAHLLYRRVGNTILITGYKIGRSQVTISKVIRIKHLKAVDVAKYITPVMAHKGGGIGVNKETNSIVVNAPAGVVEKIEKIVREVDTEQPQILIEAKLVEISGNLDKKLGLDWSWGQWDFEENPAISPHNGSMPGADDIGSLRFFGHFIRKVWDFSAVINAIKSSGDAKVLASPRVIVSNNQEAKIKTGDEVPVITSTSTNSGENATVEYKHVGVDLLVTPRLVPNSNQIIMKVKPVVSTITGWIETKNVKAPIISSRSADTVVRIKEGQALVIGGLIKDEDLKNINAVPILSQIPIIGELFKSRHISHRRTDLVAIIIPHVISQRKIKDTIKKKIKQRIKQEFNMHELSANSVKHKIATSVSVKESNKVSFKTAGLNYMKYKLEQLRNIAKKRKLTQREQNELAFYEMAVRMSTPQTKSNRTKPGTVKSTVSKEKHKSTDKKQKHSRQTKNTGKPTLHGNLATLKQVILSSNLPRMQKHSLLKQYKAYLRLKVPAYLAKVSATNMDEAIQINILAVKLHATPNLQSVVNAMQKHLKHLNAMQVVNMWGIKWPLPSVWNVAQVVDRYVSKHKSISSDALVSLISQCSFAGVTPVRVMSVVRWGGNVEGNLQKLVR